MKKIFEYKVFKDGSKGFEARQFLSTQDKKLINHLNKKLKKYNRIKIMHSNMSDNFLDLYSFIKKAKRKFRSNDGLLNEIDVLRHSNRFMMNYLSLAKLFIEQVEKEIKNGFDIKSEEFKSFQQLKSNLYDNKFSYRFMYHLRNYSHHYDFPINKMHTYIDKNEQKHMQILITADHLLEGSFNWKPILIKDFKQRKKIEVLSIIKEHLLSLEIIFQFYLDCFSIETVKYIEAYLDFKKEHGYRDSLYIVHFKDYSEYLKADVNNYNNFRPLVAENLIREYINNLERYQLIERKGNRMIIYRVKKGD